jgi:hypothetical protein|tara:strand:- start:21 stop:203 length:183 start_codon:yes stop_codon:yes gene_type:complete
LTQITSSSLGDGGAEIFTSIWGGRLKIFCKRQKLPLVSCAGGWAMKVGTNPLEERFLSQS